MSGESVFVVAVLIAAVLLVDRLGGTDELARRLFQVGLGFLLALTVMAATSAFVLPQDDEGIETAFSSDGRDQDAVDRFALAETVQIGVGIIAIMFGVGGLSRYRTVPIAALLGGVILLFSTTNPTSLYSLTSFAVSSYTSREADAIKLIVLAAGLAALTWYGFSRWERDLVTDDLPPTNGTPAE